MAGVRVGPMLIGGEGLGFTRLMVGAGLLARVDGRGVTKGGFGVGIVPYMYGSKDNKKVNEEGMYRIQK